MGGAGPAVGGSWSSSTEAKDGDPKPSTTVTQSLRLRADADRVKGHEGRRPKAHDDDDLEPLTRSRRRQRQGAVVQ
jgi:hypothetical protein